MFLLFFIIIILITDTLTSKNVFFGFKGFQKRKFKFLMSKILPDNNTFSTRLSILMTYLIAIRSKRNINRFVFGMHQWKD